MKIRLHSVLSILLVALAACTGGQSSTKASAVRPAGEGAVEILVEGVTSSKGTVYGSIFLAPEGFPGDKELAYTYRSAPAVEASDGALRLHFDAVPAGWFSVAILHDKDENEELSMNSFGVPKEKYGFSQNPESIFGPPGFDEAAVYLESGETKQVVININ